MGARESERGGGRDEHSGEVCGTGGWSLLKKICNPVRASIWIHCGKVPIVAVKWNCRAACSTIDGQGSQGHAQDNDNYSSDCDCDSDSDAEDESLSTCSFCQQRGDNTLINNSLPWAAPQLPTFLFPWPSGRQPFRLFRPRTVGKKVWKKTCTNESVARCPGKHCGR